MNSANSDPTTARNTQRPIFSGDDRAGSGTTDPVAPFSSHGFDASPCFESHHPPMLASTTRYSTMLAMGQSRCDAPASGLVLRHEILCCSRDAIIVGPAIDHGRSLA